MARPAATSGGTRYLGGTPLHPVGTAGLGGWCRASIPLRASNSATGLLVRTSSDQCLQKSEECAMLVAQSPTENGLTRLCGTSEAIAKARDGHLGRALLYHMRPPVATRRASAFVPIRRTDSRWEEGPSGGRSHPECILTPGPSDAPGNEHMKHEWPLSRRLYCPPIALNLSPPTAGRSCQGGLTDPKETER
jgi:hypothetical protein